MKHALIAGLSLFALSGAALADRPVDRQAMMEQRFSHMAERLELTDNQREALRDIFTEQRQAMQQVRAETDSKVSSVLTAEQKDTMTAMREERRERWAERGERRGDREARGERRGRDGKRG